MFRIWKVWSSVLLVPVVVLLVCPGVYFDVCAGPGDVGAEVVDLRGVRGVICAVADLGLHGGPCASQGGDVVRAFAVRAEGLKMLTVMRRPRMEMTIGTLVGVNPLVRVVGTCLRSARGQWACVYGDGIPGGVAWGGSVFGPWECVWHAT